MSSTNVQSQYTYSVVTCVTKQSEQRLQRVSTVSDRVQRTPEGHMDSDGTTARRADDQRRSVHDVSVPVRNTIGS